MERVCLVIGAGAGIGGNVAIIFSHDVYKSFLF
jgi:NAD(P)-dependent dehydrogenase (short-subunit alcohol dehydrogenase family)